MNCETTEGLLRIETVYEESESVTAIETSRRVYDFVKRTAMLTQDRTVVILTVGIVMKAVFLS